MDVDIAIKLGLSNKDIVSVIYDIHRRYIDEGTIGFRPPVSYADAIDKGEVLLAGEFTDEVGEQYVTPDSILGFLHYRRLKNMDVRLYAVAVRDEERGQGIGTLLLKMLETCHGRRIITEVKPINKKSLKFFQKNGFKIIDKKKKPKYDVYILEKLITSPFMWVYNHESGETDIVERYKKDWFK